MNDPLILSFAVIAGVALGGIFFGGLWWTIRRGASSSRPARWFLVSALLRMSVALVGFYFVGAGEWQRLVACLAGFIVARLLVMRLTRLPANATDPTAGANEPHPFFIPQLAQPKNNMIIQINTDHTINGSEQLDAEIKAIAHSALSHHQDRLSRVEVHVTDENGAKSGGSDIRCVMEARPAGLQPVAVTHNAGELADAVTGAAQKLKTALDTTFGKLKQHQS